MKKVTSILFVACLIMFTTACSNEEAVDATPTQQSSDLYQRLVALNNGTAARNANAGEKPERPQPDIYADCVVYSGIVVPATFKPESDPFDELYVMPGSTFSNGIELISDSAPGDQDYNGGRWHLNRLKDSVDPAKYANACKEEDLDLEDFESTPMYFECPLRPRRGNN